MNFGDAIRALKDGHKVAREGWNGAGKWLILVNATPNVTFREGSDYYRAGIRLASINPHIDMMTKQGTMQPGWLASQADMLAEDWFVVEDG